MNVKFLNDSALLNHTKAKAVEERKLTLEVIECLQEIYRRRLHLEKYPSLHVFCVREYGYSDSEADARIKAMRLVEDLPETKTAIGEGRLSLTTAAQIKRFFIRQEKRNVDLEVEAKQRVVESLAGKSKLETEKELIALGLELGDSEIVMRERERVVTPEITEIKVFVPQELKAKLEKLKSLLSHKYPNATNLELLTGLAEIGLEKLDPERRALRNEHKRSLRAERAVRAERTEEAQRAGKKDSAENVQEHGKGGNEIEPPLGLEARKEGATEPTNGSAKSDCKASLPETEEVYGESANMTASEHESIKVATQKISEPKIISESKIKELSKNSDLSRNRGLKTHLRPPYSGNLKVRWDEKGLGRAWHRTSPLL